MFALTPALSLEERVKHLALGEICVPVWIFAAFSVGFNGSKRENSFGRILSPIVTERVSETTGRGSVEFSVTPCRMHGLLAGRDACRYGRKNWAFLG